jgi:hypothetical protein
LARVPPNLTALSLSLLTTCPADLAKAVHNLRELQSLSLRSETKEADSVIDLVEGSFVSSALPRVHCISLAL